MPTWTDAQLTRWMIDAEEDIVSKIYMRFTSFSIPITSGQATYTLNERIYRPIRVTWQGKSLVPFIGSEIHARVPKFREEQGEPKGFQMSHDGITTIRLIPVPNESIAEYSSGLYGENIENAFIIRAFVFPDRTVDYFQIPEYLQRNLVKCYVLARAFKVEGIGQNLQASQYWKQRYNLQLGFLKKIKAEYFSTREGLDFEYETRRGQKKRLPYLPEDFTISKSAYPLHEGSARSDLNNWNDAVEVS